MENLNMSKANFKQQLRFILDAWIDVSREPIAIKLLGEDLDKLLTTYKKDFPSEIFKSPSNTLYRAILVNKKAYLKAHEGKPLILNNRPYSSWTYDVDAAESFGYNTQFTKKFTKDYVLVILKKTFSDNEILLNVEKATKFAGIINRPFIEAEKEIIVKNVNNNFMFKPQEIYLVRKNRNKDFVSEHNVIGYLEKF